MFRSLRWRLSTSYAGIALLTALAIGVILISTLRSYYARLEHDYLMSNAVNTGQSVAQMLGGGGEMTALSNQISMLSLLSQTRIRVLDANNKLLDDTGTPQANIQYTVVDSDQQGQFGTTAAGPIAIFTASRAQPPAGAFVTQTQIDNPPMVTTPPEISGTTNQRYTVVIPATAPLSDTSLLAGLNIMAPRRFSDQQITLTIFGESGQILGHLEMSDGPAYGSQIVSSVLWAWLAASLCGVVLAGASGWLVSRQITRPLLSLTAVTSQMADGDLATRADIQTGDEFEQLGHSFNEMAQRVEQTVTALKRFVADAAHELDTPLTALRTNLELIVTAQNNGTREHIMEGLAQVRRLETLTHSLLDLSRIEAHRETIASVDLAALARRVGEIAASRAEQAGLAFEVDVPDSAFRIQADEALLERAVMNLLDNALKFTPPGGSVSLRVATTPGQAIVSVADTGIGIPEDELPLLFSRFHRARNVSGYPGNGLGLAIVNAIVQARGGELSVESGAVGSRFTVRLPVGEK